MGFGLTGFFEDSVFYLDPSLRIIYSKVTEPKIILSLGAHQHLYTHRDVQ